MRSYTRIFIDAYESFINYTFLYRKALEEIYNPSDDLSYIKLYTRPIAGRKEAENIYFTKWMKIQAFLEPYWYPKLSSEQKVICMP